MDSLTKFIKAQFKQPTGEEEGEEEGQEEDKGDKEEERQVCHLSKASKLGQATVRMATCPPEANMTVEVANNVLGLRWDSIQPVIDAVKTKKKRMALMALERTIDFSTVDPGDQFIKLLFTDRMLLSVHTAE